MLLARGERGNRPQALALVTEAVATAEALGMKSLREKAVAL